MGKLQPFAIAYQHKGRPYRVTLYAENDTDARQRIASMHFNGEPQEIVWSSDTGILAKLRKLMDG